jgi:hypothetical protein
LRPEYGPDALSQKIVEFFIDGTDPEFPSEFVVDRKKLARSDLNQRYYRQR